MELAPKTNGKLGPLYQPYVWNDILQVEGLTLYEVYEDCDRAMKRAQEVLSLTGDVARVRVLAFFSKG